MTEPIPDHLIDLQKAFDQAHRAVVEASRRPGRTDTWPPEAVAELHQLREAEVQAALALHSARAGTPFAPYAQQQRIQQAARTEPDDTAAD